MSGVALVVRQLRFENRAFWRNPAAAFFTFAFPLMFLVIFTSIFQEDTSRLPSGNEVNNSTYYTASILAFSVITAAYTNVAISVVFARDAGVLKRVRGTPLPGWSYLGGKILQAIVVQIMLVIIVIVFGLIFYDVDVPTDTMPAFIGTLLLASTAFCALALATTAVIPNPDAAPPVVNAIVLPLLFLSGVFIPTDAAPEWMTTVADIFPIKHFLDATFTSYLGLTESGWEGGDLLNVAVWAVIGMALSARFFGWEPRR